MMTPTAGPPFWSSSQLKQFERTREKTQRSIDDMVKRTDAIDLTFRAVLAGLTISACTNGCEAMIVHEMRSFANYVESGKWRKSGDAPPTVQ